MKASKRLAFTAGIGTSIAVIGSLAFAGFAYADDAPTTNQEVTSSESTQAPEVQPTKPTTDPSGPLEKDSTESRGVTTDTPTPVPSDAPGQPTESSDGGQPTAAVVTPTTSNTSGTQSDLTASSEPPATPETSEVWWLLPDGGTPDNVTWPQPLLDGPSVGCGQWAQVDTYNVNDIVALTADLKLDYREDWGVAISWRFVYGGDCPVIPEKPPVTTETVDDHWTADCPGDSPNGLRIYIVTTVTHDWLYNETTNIWDANDTRNTNETPLEVTDCPVNTPITTSQPTTPLPVTTTTTGTSSPKTTASISDSPGTTPNTVSSPPTERLAQTGTNDGMIIAFAAILILAGIAFGTAAIISTRRKG